jgi:peptidoglycan/LPS O-acetylase OafA/YrhL
LSRAASTTSLALGVGLMAVSLIVRDETYRETLRFTVQGIAMIFFTVGLYTSVTGGQLLGLLEWTPIRWMGQMSYGAYLWHFDVIVAGNHFSGTIPEDHPLGLRILVAVIYAAISFAVAYVSYKSLYVPFLGLRHRFGSRSKTVPSDEPAAASGQMPLHAAPLSPVRASEAAVADAPVCATGRQSI